MTEFEKLFRSSLHSKQAPPQAAGPGSHLDPDQLSAFAESTPNERAAALDHAAQCAQCREALFLLAGARVEVVRKLRPNRWRLMWIPVAAVFCAAGLILPFYLKRDNPQPPSPALVARALPPAPSVETAVVRPHALLPERSRKFNATALPSPVTDGFSAKRGLQDTEVSSMQPIASQWRISRGAMQRSLDGGRTWLDIPIPAGEQLETVSASGATVWAGGAQGTLFRSLDNGLRWRRVHAAGLTSDVVAIEIAGENAIRLRTVDHQSWLTQDGGRTWTRN